MYHEGCSISLPSKTQGMNRDLWQYVSTKHYQRNILKTKGDSVHHIEYKCCAASLGGTADLSVIQTSVKESVDSSLYVPGSIYTALIKCTKHDWQIPLLSSVTSEEILGPTPRPSWRKHLRYISLIFGTLGSFNTKRRARPSA